MHIVKPSVALLWTTQNPEKMIELAGRTCYKSEKLITGTSAGDFVQMLIKRGHEAIIEHASASFRWICDRGITHELVRHRLASYAQESTRYCNYGKQQEIAVIQPPGLQQCDDPKVHNCVREDLHCCPWHDWSGSVYHAEYTYLRLIEYGIKPQIARSVLPTCLKTEIVVTANLREWRHISKLRGAPTAHPQIREMISMTLPILKQLAPNVFADIPLPDSK